MLYSCAGCALTQGVFRLCATKGTILGLFFPLLHSAERASLALTDCATTRIRACLRTPDGLLGAVPFPTIPQY